MSVYSEMDLDQLKLSLAKLGESDLNFIVSEMERKSEIDTEMNCDSDDSESYFLEQEIDQQWNYPQKLRKMYKNIYNEELRLDFQKKPKNLPLVGTDSINLCLHLIVRTLCFDP